jgi:hypothetical protein
MGGTKTDNSGTSWEETFEYHVFRYEDQQIRKDSICQSYSGMSISYTILNQVDRDSVLSSMGGMRSGWLYLG